LIASDRGEMQCPRCGRRQPTADECVGCGVVFAKLAAPGIARRPPPAVAPAPVPPRRGGSIGALAGSLLAIGALGLAVWAWPGRAPGNPAAAARATLPPSPLSSPDGAAAPAAMPSPPPVSGAPPESPAATAAAPSTDTAPATDTAPPAPSPTPAPSAAAGRPEGDESVPVHLPYSWYEDASGYQDAVAEARDTHKPMTVYFRTNWCPYCKRLDSELLSSGPVIAYLRSVVKVRINPEAGALEEQIARRYGVTGYPSLYLHRPAAPSFVKISGYTYGSDGPRLFTPDEFVNLLRRMLRS
jgi:thiol-disulfide isomerase/thioredoxin